MGTLTINNAACNVVIYRPEYGLLYNWYAATDGRNIAASGWHLALPSDAISLETIIGGYVNGAKLKENSSLYWDINNGTNDFGFNGRGSGNRVPFFYAIRGNFFMWHNGSSGSYGFCSTIQQNSNFVVVNYQVYQKYGGMSIRLVKDSTALSNGQTGTYVGNDGKVYRTICIGTQEWLADNLAETKFRNGDIIPWYGANPANYFTDAEWNALITAGCCAYSNDVNNVAAGFTFPS